MPNNTQHKKIKMEFPELKNDLLLKPKGETVEDLGMDDASSWAFLQITEFLREKYLL